MARNKIETILNQELQKKVIKVEKITDEIMDHVGQVFQAAYAKSAIGKKSCDEILKETYEKIRGEWTYR